MKKLVRPPLHGKSCGDRDVGYVTEAEPMVPPVIRSFSAMYEIYPDDETRLTSISVVLERYGSFPVMFIDNVPDSTVMFPELRTEPRFSSITVPFCMMMRITTFFNEILPFTELNEIPYVPLIEPADPEVWFAMFRFAVGVGAEGLGMYPEIRVYAVDTSVTVIAIRRIVAIIGDTALSCLNTLFMNTVQNVWLV
jgi:hypothetical protein